MSVVITLFRAKRTRRNRYNVVFSLPFAADHSRPSQFSNASVGLSVFKSFLETFLSVSHGWNVLPTFLKLRPYIALWYIIKRGWPQSLWFWHCGVHCKMPSISIDRINQSIEAPKSNLLFLGPRRCTVHTSVKFHRNPFMIFLVMSRTNKQTGENVTFFLRRGKWKTEEKANIRWKWRYINVWLV